MLTYGHVVLNMSLHSYDHVMHSYDHVMHVYSHVMHDHVMHVYSRVMRTNSAIPRLCQALA